MKTALVTGANKGIGYEIARQLGLKGFSVLVAARNEARGQKAVSELKTLKVEAHFVACDVGDLSSIKSAFAQVQAITSQLDVLVNNAGILHDENQDVFTLPDELFAETLQVNALGALHMVRVFRPLLKQGSRVINISSGGGAICEGASTWAPAYCISKTAMNAATLQLAAGLSGTGISINAVCPGWVRTDMGGSGASRSVAEGADTPVWLATEADSHLTGKFIRDRAEIPW